MWTKGVIAWLFFVPAVMWLLPFPMWVELPICFAAGVFATRIVHQIDRYWMAVKISVNKWATKG
jgi:hypothetical protein